MVSKAVKFFNGEYIKEDLIEYRNYQNNIIKKCSSKNSLVVLPTGLGKTIIGILLISHRLKKYPIKGKVIILAPTRPLVHQHLSSCQKFLDVDHEKIVSLTGKISPEKRINLFRNSQIIISTPQVIKNDIMRGRYSLSYVSLIIFDEAHRTHGNYSYNFISNEYIKKCSDPLILGLTASPGKDYERIQSLCQNLFVENIIFKTYKDNDVKNYVYDIDTILERVELPVFIIEISQIIENIFNKFLQFFIDRDLINSYKRYYSKMDFLNITNDLTFSLNYGDVYNSHDFDDEFQIQLYYQDPKIIDIVRNNKLNIHSIYSYCSSCISLLHAKELLETQEISLFQSFLDKLELKSELDNLAAKRIISSKHFKLIKDLLKRKSSDICHPKINNLLSIIQEEYESLNNEKFLIFTQYREMAQYLKKRINKQFGKDLIAEKFIGQSSKIDDPGFSQHRQIDIIQKFRETKINILIATSVAEEGLDIPNVDCVIFYEPVPSEIRLIQRRGRTGRNSSGRCYILLTDGTVDVPFYKVSLRKENKMMKVLSIPEELSLQEDLNRERICFENQEKKFSQSAILKSYRERREKEKQCLANRSIEQILDKLDEFATSEKCKDYKNQGVTFLSEVMDINRTKLKKGVFKMKKANKKKKTKRKRYLNNNVKTLINLADTYNIDGKLKFEEFKELAEFEEIIEDKFYIHFNRACYLGYLKKENDFVYFLKEAD
ncbi:MAG: DEAD/DEAH box helicase [Candidatus Lokiarchaeota archaeon]|nr:DEAD/DEAH box helicase [Candidatus Lokiarchaeota archaeon]MBD3201850.1 DEAD/DEAH box helicase [Candidatus Lokiarchaeota archaeon]